MVDLDAVVAGWRVAELPTELRGAEPPVLEEVGRVALDRLAAAGGAGAKSRVETAVAEWLFGLVRGNVKRGRFFELEDVLSTGRADCLGYTRLFAAIGRRFGLDLGIVEVITDNAGRYVPHHVTLVNLSNGAYRFMDAWYGSTDVSHRRIGAMVDGEMRDIDREQLAGVKDLKGLPERCVDAIALYIRGNGHLERDELDQAIRCYSEAARLYPNNTRAFYNRALAYERIGMGEEAAADYAEALKDESSTIRVLASIEGIEGLLRLDERGIGDMEQDIYLSREGFKMGEPVGYEELGRIYRLPSEEVEAIATRVKAVCGL